MEQQLGLFNQEDLPERAILDQLLEDSRLYRTSKEYMELLDFVSRMRNFAPFNALLLHIQKPGLTYAASLKDWHERFNRRPKLDARPLLILRPFAPVALVYDVQDTEGDPLPPGAILFRAEGKMTSETLQGFFSLLHAKGIQCEFFDGGDGKAGSIRVVQHPTMKQHNHQKPVRGVYRLALNRNHEPNVQFATLVHEMGHLLLGHLGQDQALKIQDRRGLSHRQAELEAESFAYVMCMRHGVKSESAAYLANYVDENTEVDHLDIYQILRAVGQLETLLQRTAHTSFGPHK